MTLWRMTVGKMTFTIIKFRSFHQKLKIRATKVSKDMT